MPVAHPGSSLLAQADWHPGPRALQGALWAAPHPSAWPSGSQQHSHPQVLAATVLGTRQVGRGPLPPCPDAAAKHPGKLLPFLLQFIVLSADVSTCCESTQAGARRGRSWVRSTRPLLWVQPHAWWPPVPVPAVTGAQATLVWMEMLASSDLGSECAEEREQSVQ